MSKRLWLMSFRGREIESWRLVVGGGSATLLPGVLGGVDDLVGVEPPPQVVEELVAEVGVEPHGEQLQQLRQALEQGQVEALVVGEVHQQRPQAALQQLLGQRLGLAGRHVPEALLGRSHDAGHGGGQRLEEAADYALADALEGLRVPEGRPGNRGAQQLDAHRPQT
eukprot:scaffold336631_cov34-Prasinocladus_malaysianus.AAC.3